MGRPRSELQSLLRDVLGSSQVYFQKPSNTQMLYPAIVYKYDYASTRFGNNLPYSITKRYEITVMDRNPDSDIPDKIAKLPMCVFDRFFVVDGLNHFVYKLFF